ncbi:MAG TPA: aldo/keto reductase [Micromonosporaceae bacterium]|jgi:aryl-alcohol dehydrogenase-like predicted oxidoreductase
MRYARLGRSDLEVSVLGLGCGNFGGIGSTPELFERGDDERTAFALMDAARDAGITLFDTANSYGGGRSEEWVGRWLASRPGARDEIVLTTKVRNRVGTDPRDEGLSRQHIRSQIDASLRRLHTDRVDLYLAHEPDPDVPLAETVATFDELIRVGKIRHYGLSNFSGAQLHAAIAAATAGEHAEPVNLQSSFSLLDRAAAADTFAICGRHGVAFTAFSPLAGGWLTGKYRAGSPYPAGSRMTLRPEPYASFTTGSTYRMIDELARTALTRGLSLPTMALAWVLEDPGVTAAIIGPRTPSQIAAACDAIDVTIDPQEHAALADVADRHDMSRPV